MRRRNARRSCSVLVRYRNQMATESFPEVRHYLVIESPNAPTLRVYLVHDQYTLGRSSINDLAFPDDHKLSREHLIFKCIDGSWIVSDVGSRNGTQLNAVRLTDSSVLAHNDQIIAGRLNIHYEIHGRFTDANAEHVTFVEQPSARVVPAVSLDLKSTLENRTDPAHHPALENAHLSALVQAGREMARHGELEKLCALVLDLSLAAVKASRGVVMTSDGEGVMISRAVRGEELIISTGVRDLVLKRARSLLIHDVMLDRDFRARGSILAQDIRSILAVPLQTDERVIGMLYLDSPHLVRKFTAEDLNLVTVMANIAAIRIEHARLVKEEELRKLLGRDLQHAAEIQRRLLPSKVPEVVGFDLAGCSIPCRTVGGDYYDFLSYPDGRTVILIGDVSGKGLGAALLMAHLQACAHLLFENPEPLSSQVSRLNGRVAANCAGNAFITLFAAVLDSGKSEFAYCNAGHNPSLVLRSNRVVEKLGATGIPLGIMRDARYEENTFRLSPGDSLVLFSDGVTEACGSDDSDEFGEQRLISVVQKQQGEPAANVIQAVNEELERFTHGVRAADDVTFVVVRCLDARGQ